MIQYHPIESGAPWTDADFADLASFDWQRKTAVFAIVGDSRTFEVSFLGGSAIVRILDDFPLSTESEAQNQAGLVPHHFAYRVEGDAFFEAQSKAWRTVEGTPSHYRFVTGAGCLDVVTSATPQFRMVDC